MKLKHGMMRSMTLPAPKAALIPVDRMIPVPSGDDILVRVLACGVCRTDPHLIDGELPHVSYPLVPGHEIVGVVETIATEASRWSVGDRVGIGWLGKSCGECVYCVCGQENLCDRPQFTGCHRDGGFATHAIVDSRFAFALNDRMPAEKQAPLLCAGLIGWRALKAAGDEAQRIGIFGFGAAGHLIAQIALARKCEVFAFTRPGDVASQKFARSLGAQWAGGSDEQPPSLLDAALIFAPVGDLIPRALHAVRKGGRVICGGIHMSDIPSFPYRALWEERRIESVANLTRADGIEFLAAMHTAPVEVATTTYRLSAANEAIADLRAGRVKGAAVLLP